MARSVTLFRDPETGMVYTERPQIEGIEEFTPGEDHPEWKAYLAEIAARESNPQPEQKTQEPATDVL